MTTNLYPTRFKLSDPQEKEDITSNVILCVSAVGKNHGGFCKDVSLIPSDGWFIEEWNGVDEDAGVVCDLLRRTA